MQVRLDDLKSKMEAIYVPSSLEETQHMKMIPEKILLNQGNNNIHCIRSFRYLGAIITDDLTEDAEVKV